MVTRYNVTDIKFHENFSSTTVRLLLCIPQVNVYLNEIISLLFRERIDRLIRDQSNSQACMPPDLPIYSSEMMKFVRQEEPIDCSTAAPDWVTCEVNLDC